MNFVLSNRALLIVSAFFFTLGSFAFARSFFLYNFFIFDFFYAFRAFEEPSLQVSSLLLTLYATCLIAITTLCFYVCMFLSIYQPLFPGFKHLASDELMGAWSFLLGTIPAVPYTLVFWIYDPTNVIYLGAFVMSIVFVIATYLFVLGCYPSDKVTSHIRLTVDCCLTYN